MKFLILLLILAGQKAQAQNFDKRQLTGYIGLEQGISSPYGPLSDILDFGSVTRLRAFAGVKVPQAGDGAFGMGLDLSYSDFPLTEGLSGHYRRIVWDWFFLPLGWGYWELTPGISWVATDVRIREYGARMVSFRPGVMLGLGFRVPLTQSLTFSGQIRSDRSWEDRVILSNQDAPFKTLAIKGTFVSASLGLIATL